MAHFAKVLDGKVVNVIVAEPEFFDTFVDSSPGDWIQTSYNTKGGVHYDPITQEPDGGVALRYNYASVGDYYDSVADAFYKPQPHASWILNTDTYLWDPPIEKPERTQEELDDLCWYRWDEAAHQADNTAGWVLVCPEN